MSLNAEQRARIAAILGAVLGRALDPSEKVLRSAEPRWDSIKHLELVFSVEDAFEIRFEEIELPQLDSLEALTVLVERHLAT